MDQLYTIRLILNNDHSFVTEFTESLIYNVGDYIALYDCEKYIHYKILYRIFLPESKSKKVILIVDECELKIC
jgi:hypothetical protein